MYMKCKNLNGLKTRCLVITLMFIILALEVLYDCIPNTNCLRQNCYTILMVFFNEVFFNENYTEQSCIFLFEDIIVVFTYILI